MSKIITSRARFLENGVEDECFVFFKISQPGYPENCVVETEDGLISYIKYLEGDEEEAFVITPTYMSVREYNTLPEFEGF